MAATYQGDFDLENESYEQQTSRYSDESDQSAPEESLDSDGTEEVIGKKINESATLKGLGSVICGRKKSKGKPGRKAKWTDECTDDLVDIICNNEVYKKRSYSPTSRHQRLVDIMKRL